MKGGWGTGGGWILCKHHCWSNPYWKRRSCRASAAATLKIAWFQQKPDWQSEPTREGEKVLVRIFSSLCSSVCSILSAGGKWRLEQEQTAEALGEIQPTSSSSVTHVTRLWWTSNGPLPPKLYTQKNIHILITLFSIPVQLLMSTNQLSANQIATAECMLGHYYLLITILYL